jgi:hypothetical protein
MSVVPNNSAGIFINFTPSTVIGGADPAARNVISGNGSSGVQIISAGNNSIAGNLIGLNASGTRSLGNRVGVEISQGDHNLIGAAEPNARNIISGNRSHGVSIAGFGQGNTIQGNYIGTDGAGLTDISNAASGIFIDGVPTQTTIGGTALGAGNLISGNGDGIDLRSSNGTVQGNLIGTDVTGNGPLPNRNDGIVIRGSFNNIGGTAPGAGNRVAFNQSNGIRVTEASALGNTIARNAIWANRYLGINLDATGQVTDPVTMNDPTDADPGPNRLQNFPTLTNTIYTGATLVVQGFFQGVPNHSFNIDFYANAAIEPALTVFSIPFGEGQQFIAQTTVTTPPGGRVDFSFSIPAAISNQYVTATATDLTTGDTSEFSQGIGGLRIIEAKKQGADVDVTFTSYPGRHHRLEYASSLTNTITWQAVTGAENIAAIDQFTTATDPGAAALTRFYRAVLLP